MTAAQLGCPVLYTYSVLVPLCLRLALMFVICVTAGQAVNSHDVTGWNKDPEKFAQSVTSVVLTLVPLLFYVLTIIIMLFVAINANSPFSMIHLVHYMYFFIWK